MPFLVVGAVTAFVWPTVALLCGALAVLAVLAIRAPRYAFLLGLGMYGLEATIKLGLTVEGVPSALGAGAAVIDLAFVGGVLALALADRGVNLRRVWAAAPRGARITLVCLGVWLVMSLFQVLQTGDLVQGLKGLRLGQLYVVGAIGGLLLLAPPARERRIMAVLLAIATAIAGYAALRGLIGPSETERSFALQRSQFPLLGGVFRDIGSFSTPIAMVSFLVPAAVLGLVIGYVDRGFRVLGWTLFVLASAGVVASYVRIAAVAVLVGPAFVTLVLLLGRDVPRKVRMTAVGLTVVVAAVGSVAVVSAGGSDTRTRQRAKGLSSPLSDPSMKDRYRTWRRTIRRIGHQPFGIGVGTIGHASAGSVKGARATGGDPNYTDNSFLKVFREQGVIGGVVFVLGTLGLAIAVAVRLARDGPLRHPLGVASLAGFISFLTLFLLGEYIEQPGKTLGWTLLGLALWDAYGRAPGSWPEPVRGWSASAAARQAASAVRARWRGLSRTTRTLLVAATAILVVGPALFSLTRQATYYSPAAYVAAQQPPLVQRALRLPAPTSRVERLLARPKVRDGIRGNLGFTADEPKLLRGLHVHTAPTTQTVTVLTIAAPGDTPEHAEQLARTVGQFVDQRTEPSRTFLVPAIRKARLLRVRLRAGNLAPAERRLTERELAAIGRALQHPLPPLSFHGIETPRLTNRTDRAVKSLPGHFPPRQALLWMVLGGLGLSVALGAVVLLGQEPNRAPPRPAA
jgi:hypothetical protein